MVAKVIAEFKNFSFQYRGSDFWALKNIEQKIYAGEFVVIAGENGAGKSTLCKCLNGIIPHSEKGKIKGEVIINGKATTDSSIASISQKVGIVLENPASQIFTTKVKNEVAFGPENLNMPKEEIEEAVSWALEVVDLKEQKERNPSVLSGGEKQRLAIAAALAMNPDMLVLDEPTSELDPLGTEEVFAVIKDLKEKYNMTIVMATHKTNQAVKFADHIWALKEGRVKAKGRPAEIFRDPELVSNLNIALPEIFALIDYLEKASGKSIESFLQENSHLKELSKIIQEVI